MNKISKIIEELCPNGVEYKKLNEVANIERGQRITKKDLVCDGLYDVYSGGIYPLGKFNKFNREPNTITIASYGTAGFVNFIETKFWANDVCLSIIIIDETKLNNRFLFYVLKNMQNYLYSNTTKALPDHIPTDFIKNLEIPIPPLVIQEKIVEYLDAFTKLEAELEAELEARKLQYEYYRDELLKFDEDTPVKELRETCNMKAGKAISVLDIVNLNDESNKYECFGANGIRGYVRYTSHVGEYPIIGRQGALCGNINYAVGEFYATEHAVVVTSLGEYSQRFLYYLLIAMNLNQYKSQGAQPGLAVGNIEKLVAPVPPMDKQKEIVDILDKFNVYINSIDSGLKGEIEANRQRYEYYRDKLLTFKRKEE